MKVLVIGATGTIGHAVADTLAHTHEVVRIGHSSGDVRISLESTDSMEQAFVALKPFDAVVCAAGVAVFKPFARLGDADYELSFRNKLMGQVNLVRMGMRHINDRGSFTLTGGVLATEGAPGGAAIGMVNAGLEGFARNASLDLPRGIRLNIVSPPWVSETLEEMGQDPSAGVPAIVVARAYVEAVEGSHNGQVLDPRYYEDESL
jgi:NAD(P)-dependent dehydrogenase (short-subunit alcohol dehydrogenase family)